MLRFTALCSLLFSLHAIISGPAWAQSGAMVGNRQPRKLAPGVLTVIPPQPVADETFDGPRPIIEIVKGSAFKDWDPNYSPKTSTLKDIATRVTFRRTVWNLEFAFKPVRMIYVDIPQPSGKMQRKLVWYMAYRVRNTGAHMNPAAADDEYGHKLYAPAAQNYSVRLFPRFIFEVVDKEADEKTGEMKLAGQKAYLDRVIPMAARPIQTREDPAIRLFNSVEVSQIDIPVSTERSDKAVWGLATWTDIDQTADYFSIYIEGLTNAYKWVDPEGAWNDGDPPGNGRRFANKLLKLDFWRPGDATDAHEDEIRFGFPGELPYQWLYR